MIQRGDICKLAGNGVEPVELIIGGSPCQNISISGNREGLNGIESKLFLEQIRLISEMRVFSRSPRFMVWENVSNIFSCNKGNDFKKVLALTAGIVDREAGDAFGNMDVPKNGWQKAGALFGESWSIAWRLTNARYFGIPQSRRRIALVADFDGLTAPDILFGTKPLAGAPERPVMFKAYRNGAWEDAGDEILRHSDYGDGPEIPVESDIMDFLDPHAAPEFYISVKSCQGIFKRADKRHKEISPALAKGLSGNILLNPKEKGLPEGEPVIVEALHHNGFGDYKAGTFSSALKASGGDVGFGSECLVVTKFVRDDHEPVYTVRRLSVTECERIQGYDDGWTDIGPWTAPSGKYYPSTPSALRGKALGNSIVLPQWEYILSGIYDRCREKTMASLFDGLGGFPLIWERLGGKAVWSSEIDAFPSAVTKLRFH